MLKSLGFLVNLVASAFGGIPSSVIRGAVGLVAPVTALLVLATALSAVMLVLVLVVTSLVERARGARGHALRFLVSHGARLALIAIAIGAFAAAVALT